MKFRFTIAWKIGTGFTVLLFLTIVVFYTTNETLSESKRISDDINEIYNPSVYELEVLKLNLIKSNNLIAQWNQVQLGSDAPDKKEYIKLIEEDIPKNKERIKNLYKKWIDREKHLAEQIFDEIDTLFAIQGQIRENLNSFDAYDDVEAQFLSNLALEESEIQMQEIDLPLQDLITREKNNALKVSADMVKSFDLLQFLVRYLGIALIIMGIIISIYTTRSIVKPVNYLKGILLDLSKGIIERRKIRARNDEIGEMTMALNKLIEGLNRTKDFANALGSGNYDFPYTLLSDQDELGEDLLKMRTDLAEHDRILEEKVKQRTAEVVRQKEEIEAQSQEIGRLYDEVTDSIVYARRIQRAILQPISEVQNILPNSFIFFKPKDIVSGDFYWVEKKDGLAYFAATDCTGHGVPGAFMSIIGHNGLNQALNFCDKPSEILDALNEGLSQSLHQSSGQGETKDGMDIGLCSYNKKKKELQFAGAFNPLYVVRDGELQITKADKFPVGSFVTEEKLSFTNHVMKVKEGDMIYICSDGFQDQFGGPKGKKYMIGKLKNLFVELSAIEVDKQPERFETELKNWMGEEDQVDDILIIGLRITA